MKKKNQMAKVMTTQWKYPIYNSTKGHEKKWCT